MKVIKKITISNFQAHKRMTIHLDDFSFIVGLSSAGKTTIMRALEWLLYGEWDKTYPNDINEEVAVAIQLDDDTLVGRFRLKDANKAAVKLPDGRILKYKDFGDTIPGIFDLLNVRPIKVGDREVNLNFSQQDEPIFMVHESWSKPAKAQWIGRLYGAHIINSMVRFATSDKREAEADRKRAEAEVNSLKSALIEFKGIEAAEKALKMAQDGLDRLGAMESCKAELGAITEAAEALHAGAPILKFDPAQVRADVVKLVEANSIMTELEDLAKISVEMSDKDGLLVFDPKALHAALERLAGLYEALAVSVSLPMKEADLVKSLAKTEKELKKARVSVKEAVMADGHCPICMSKPKKLAPEELAERLRNFVGVKNDD